MTATPIKRAASPAKWYAAAVSLTLLLGALAVFAAPGSPAPGPLGPGAQHQTREIAVVDAGGGPAQVTAVTAAVHTLAPSLTAIPATDAAALMAGGGCAFDDTACWTRVGVDGAVAWVVVVGAGQVGVVDVAAARQRQVAAPPQSTPATVLAPLLAPLVHPEDAVGVRDTTVTASTASTDSNRDANRDANSDANNGAPGPTDPGADRGVAPGGAAGVDTVDTGAGTDPDPAADPTPSPRSPWMLVAGGAAGVAVVSLATAGGLELWAGALQADILANDRDDLGPTLTGVETAEIATLVVGVAGLVGAAVAIGVASADAPEVP